MKQWLLLWVGIVPLTHGGIVLLGEYKFDGTSDGDNQFNHVTTQPANATFSTVVRVNVDWNGGANVFTSKNWSTGTSVDTTKYVEFSITAAPEFTITLDRLVFGAGRSSTGPTNAQVSVFNMAAPAHNATANAAFVYQPGVHTSPGVDTYTFDFPNFTTIGGGTVTFRFYGYQATGSGGTLRFDNVQLYGDIAPVPEPIEWALGIFGALLIGSRAIQYWRKRRGTPALAAAA
jgi:hypothetical protein